MPSTFIFADLAGFSALTEAHGDQSAAEIALDFARVGASIARKHGAEFVKSIGDALMIRVPDPSCAARLGLKLATKVFGAHGHPAVRVGMHHGPAVSRSGDWFGSTVNIAARIGSLAGPRQVLLSETVAACTAQSGVILKPLGPALLRNIPTLVNLVEARCRQDTHCLFETDPVCRMLVDPRRTDFEIVLAGTKRYFCSNGCARKFSESPGVFLDSGASPEAVYASQLNRPLLAPCR